MAAEQRRIASEVTAKLAADAPGRHAAIVFAYGASPSAADGDRMATRANESFTDAPFTGSLFKSYHELITGDLQTSIAFEIYFDE